MQKYKQESLSAAMKESGLLIAKICACVIAGVVVIWGLVTGTETLLTALKTMHEQYDNSMCYIVCATGWFFLVLSNWLWITYSLYKARTGSTVGGGLQFMLLLSLLAECFSFFVIFWSLSHLDITDIQLLVMGITTLMLFLSLNVKVVVIINHVASGSRD
ncbi:TPA: hypothetical protein QBF94_005127 [Escherichia coli O22:H16]|nr:hypothetical protein [Escherichia coli O22:H16]